MLNPPRVRGYAIERLLGRGASGDVWQARVGTSGARVALKRILARSDEQVRRAQDEAALLAALDHENLVRLHALLAADDAMVLVLDLADGGSLANLLAARGRLTPGEVITAVAPVAAAVAYLHDVGIVHGDISPANILFSTSGMPMLSDVGVARLTGDDSDAAATPAYVDPAVAAGCIPGPQSDVFMLGGVALHALTGAPPWPDADPELAIARAALGVLDDLPDRLRAADTPDAMSVVLCRALSVDPQRRGTAADFALELRHGGQPVAVEMAAGRAGVTDQSGRPSGPRHAAAASSPPTRMVAARPRPVIPRPVHSRPGWLPWVAGGVALTVIAVVLITLAHGLPGRSAARALSTPRAEVETSSTSASAPTRRHAHPPAGWLARLDALDAVRARAFATRDVRMLRKVYTAGPLLHSDAALLTDLVPVGCGLPGARTSYTNPVVRQAASRVRITVRATLLPSRLMCAGRLRGRAAGRGPTTLQIVLVHTSAGLRIAGQRSR